MTKEELAKFEEQHHQHLKSVNNYAVRIKDNMKAQGFDADLFAELSPALALAAIVYRIK